MFEILANLGPKSSVEYKSFRIEVQKERTAGS